MPTLSEVVHHVRTKNAGPFWLTVDIFCETAESFNTIKNSTRFTASKVAEIFNVKKESVKAFYIEDILSIKFSFPRPHIQGCVFESDMHAGQQYDLLLDVEV